MTNGNSAEMLRFKKWYKTREQHDSGMITTWQHTWEGWQARASLSVCADGGKDSSEARDMSDFIAEDGLSEQFRIWRECRDAAIAKEPK